MDDEIGSSSSGDARSSDASAGLKNDSMVHSQSNREEDGDAVAAGLNSSSPSRLEEPPQQSQHHASPHETAGVYHTDAPEPHDKETSNSSSEEDDDDNNNSPIDHSQLIREASEAAVAQAVAMKRSDSDLSSQDDDNVFEEEEAATAGGRSMSIAYLEHASFEAELLSEHHHRLQPSGRLGRLRQSVSNEIIDVMDDDDDGDNKNTGDSISNLDDIFDDNDDTSRPHQRQASQRQFQSMSRSSLPTVADTIDNHEDDSMRSTNMNSQDDDDDDDEIPRHQSLSRMETFELTNLVEELAIDTVVTDEGGNASVQLSEEALFLNGLFSGFCRPAIPINALEDILQMEHGASRSRINRDDTRVELPVGAVIANPSTGLLDLLDNRNSSFLRLPRVLALSICRILVRILTGASDLEYDYCIITYCPWHEDLLSQCSDATDTSSNSNKQSLGLHKMYPGSDEATRANLVYSVVRLRMQWHNAPTQALNLLDSLLESPGRRDLFAPVTLLLGVLCAGGVTPKELRRMIGVASAAAGKNRKCSIETQLMMVRALGIAASSASKPAASVGNIHPLLFFSLLTGPGINRTISLEKASWPFRNDFCAAFSFRAEELSSDSTAMLLFSAMGDGGNGIEIALASLPKEGNDHASAAVLRIAVMEEFNAVKTFNVTNCPLHARVWYHAAVRHTRSRLKGVFSLSAKEQMTVMVDGKVMLSESVHFPQIHEDYSSTALSFTYGKKFDGQLGALCIFHENVSDSALKKLLKPSADASNGLSRQPSRKFEIKSHHKEHVAKIKSLSRVGKDDLRDITVCDHSIPDASSSQMSSADASDDASGRRISSANGLYLVWEPQRTSGNSFLIETYSGAHVSLAESDQAELWELKGAQDVISSIGGVQVLILILHSLLCPDTMRQGIDISGLENADPCEGLACFTLLPDVIFLLSAFVSTHPQNSREMLRCGAIEVLGGLVQKCSLQRRQSKLTFYDAVTLFPSLASLLVRRLLELRSKSRDFVGLETAVLSLLFNIPLWLGGLFKGDGVALASELLPELSTILTEESEMCDFVSVSDIVFFLEELTALQSNLKSDGDREVFCRDRNSLRSLMTAITVEERHHIADTMLYWVLLVFRSGISTEDFGSFLSLLSKNLDAQFEETATMTAEGNEDATKVSFVSEQRDLLTAKLCLVLFFAFQAKQIDSKLFESFAETCGGFQQASAWILSAMINCHDDQIRGIGIQCLVVFVRAISSRPDQPLDMAAQTELTQKKTFQENTITLMNSVGNGILSSHVGKGIAAMAGSKLVPPTKLTPRVIYKLLWHLVKSHRYRMKQCTHASLVAMVFEDNDGFELPVQNTKGCRRIDFVGAASRVASVITIRESSISDDILGVSTMLRLLRFLPDEYLNKWLAGLVDLATQSFRARTVLASSPNWQACLFQLVSESIEKTGNTEDSDKETNAARDRKSDEIQIFDRTLELYGLLLGRLFRIGGDRSIAALEDCAALQRVFVNGPEAFALVLSQLLHNLFEYGIALGDLQHNSNLSESDRREPIKETAQKITNEILSNGAPSAVASWRVLRYLTTAVVAFATTMPASSSETEFWNDGVSGGLCGVLLPENGVSRFSARDVAAASGQPAQSRSPVDLCLRIRLNVVEQLFTILDVFIFPATASSQLHGLALVRGAETRGGNIQGPVLVSLLRASLFQLQHLDPSSVQALQCCSRLLCLCHYSLELLRESQALEGYTSGFANVTAPLDRVLMAVVLQAHATLRKCALVLKAIESDTLGSVFPDRESRKKRHRRLFKVCIELREVLATLLERRKSIFQELLTKEAYSAFRSIMESKAEVSGSANAKPQSEKEFVVRRLLSSEWINNFESSSEKGGATMVLQNESFAHYDDSTEIDSAFQKSLNNAFEDYLEQQRNWTESSAVRDLEFEGDTTMKQFANKCDLLKSNATRSDLDVAAQRRVQLANQLVEGVSQPTSHWRMDSHEDPASRRILLVPNKAFNDHKSASYELMMGSEQQQQPPSPQKTERLTRDEFPDFVRRNSSAFVPDETLQDDLDVDDDLEEEFLQIDKDGNDAASDQTDDNEVVIEPDSSAVNPDLDGADTGLVDARKDAQSPLGTKVSIDTQDTEDESQGDAWARTFVWTDTECILARFEEVTWVTLETVFQGKLLLTTHNLYFRIDDGVDVFSKEAVDIPDDMRSVRYKLGKLTEIHGRRYLLRPQALELFFVDGNEVFLSFLNHKERNRFYAKTKNSCKAPLLSQATSLNPRIAFKRSKLTSLWKKRQISNFDYLMALNRMAGRTFNDISQYPVFPWILADYDSEKIDLSDTRVYRDLSKPIGALNPERLALLLERFNELESFGFAKEEKFLYGSHYSSPGMVVHFNLRQEPFTTMAVSLQGGRFDVADRLFFDLSETWRSCNTSTSDVKELIPELFTMPEILLNQNNLPLGKTQRGLVVDDVGLPPWAKGSAHEFVRIHRLALESEYTSRNLHSWIDLIFGFKQRGPEAEAAHNLFHHLSYEGSVDLDKIADELDRQAAESHIQNFGQTPAQLSTVNHPTRNVPEDCWQPLINNMSNAVRLRCHTPAQSQQFGKKGTDTSGFVASIFVGGDGLIALYSDLKVGFFKWSPKSPSHRLSPERLKILQYREGSRSNAVLKRGNAVLSDVENDHAVGNWSFAVTHGGREIANKKRKALASSRLASAKEALYTESPPMIVSCGYFDNTLKVHSIDDGSQSESKYGHSGEITCLSTGNSDEGFLVTGGDDCLCKVWAVAYPDLATALSDGYTQTAMDQKNSESQILSCLHTLFGHESPICCIDFSTELDVVVSGSVDGTVCVHKLRSGSFVRSFKPSSKRDVSIRKLALERHGRMVVHTSDLRLYTFTVNGARLCFANAGERIHDMKISGEVVITGGEKSHVYIRNLSTLKVLSGLDLTRHGPIRCLSMTPETLNPLPQHLFIGSDDGMISIVEHD